MSIFAALGAKFLGDMATKGVDKLLNKDEKTEDDSKSIARQAETSAPISLKDQGISIIRKGATNFAESAISRGSDRVLDLLLNKSARKMGKEAGQYKKAMFDQFAPSTSQFERIGSPGAGGNSIAAAQQGVDARKAINLQMKHQKEIVDKQVAGQVKVAEIAAGPGHREVDFKNLRWDTDKQQIIANTKKMAAEAKNIKDKNQWLLALDEAKFDLDRAMTSFYKTASSKNLKDAALALEKSVNEKNMRGYYKARGDLGKALNKWELEQKKHGHLQGVTTWMKYIAELFWTIALKGKTIFQDTIKNLPSKKDMELYLKPDPYQGPGSYFNNSSKSKRPTN